MAPIPKPLSYYEGLAKAVAQETGHQYVAFVASARKTNPSKTIDYINCKLQAVCRREGCEAIGQKQINKIKKGGLVYCAAHEKFTGFATTPAARLADCLKKIAPCGVIDPQKVNAAVNPLGAGNELISYTCPRPGCATRVVHTVNTIIAHGSDPLPCTEHLFRENAVARVQQEWGYQDAKVEEVKWLIRKSTGNKEVDHTSTRVSVRCQGADRRGRLCTAAVTMNMGYLGAAARGTASQYIRCPSCKYVVTTIDRTKFIVMNGYERATAEVFCARGYRKSTLHTTHR